MKTNPTPETLTKQHAAFIAAGGRGTLAAFVANSKNAETIKRIGFKAFIEAQRVS